VIDARFSDALEQRAALVDWLTDNPNGRRWFRDVMGNLSPHDRPAMDANTVEQSFRSATLASLMQGAPYYWSGVPLTLVQDAAPAIPDWTLSEEVIPDAYGFFWFASPLPLPDHPDHVAPLRAVSWANVVEQEGRAFMPFGEGLRAYEGERLRFVFYLDVRGAAIPAPFTMADWIIGEPLSRVMEQLHGQVADSVKADRMTMKLRYAAACFSFIHQRIVTAGRVRADRATRRRLALTRDDPAEVRVIELRRRAYERDLSDARRTVDWSCRWLVRGHWRRIENGARVTWVVPHVKGPESKPLKRPRADVFAVVR
jgi:hypothetical protein